MAAPGKRSMPTNANPSAKRGKGDKGMWKQGKSRVNIEAGDVGVFVTCDMGKEGKCMAETVDIFSQVGPFVHHTVCVACMASAGANLQTTPTHADWLVVQELESSASPAKDDDDDEEEDDIEAQIQKELAGLKPNKDKKRPFQAFRLEMPCVIFVRLDPSIDPVELVHRLCREARADPETKRSRFIKRMTPVTSIRKTLRFDMEAFTREILKPHFHSGGPPRRYAIRPSIRGNGKFKRNPLIKTIADIVGPEHPVNLTNYDKMILVDVCQNVIGMSVVDSDYDQLKRFNLAEIYDPSPKPVPKETTKESLKEEEAPKEAPIETAS
ncbi:hypothetical protein N7462_009547 [Penicillium macrosclerotiorum]|uniref:uncharacterized protein n=1 Tax=Penicillium macrosclerotiorum TaxID=303699 RepID=UPI00254669B9|nr:uncharacterized protein N7462_009547 [Penicillium macrosclerotiorum]KAJ5674108.1 hypothetical protein N7462_009547 [Penicillium macrosclerotiorum]